MNIGIVAADTAKWPKMTWLATAFEHLGHSVRICREPDELRRSDAWADGVVFRHRSVIRWPNLKDLANQRRATWVQIWFDLLQTQPGLPLHDQPGVQRHVDLMNAMDCLAVKERIDNPGKVLTPIVYIDQGIPEALIVEPRQTRPQYDVVVFGQGKEKYPQRYEDAKELVRAGYGVLWIGAAGAVPQGVTTRPFVSPADLPLVVSRLAKIVLSVGRRWDIDGYASDALYLAIASGLPVIRRSTAEHPAPVLTYRDSDRLLYLVSRIIKDRAATEAYVKECQEWLRANRTTKHTASALADLIALTAEARATSRRPDLTASRWCVPAGAPSVAFAEG